MALGQQVRVVGHLHALGNLRLGQRLRRRAPRVDDRLFALDLLPLERLLRAVDVEALAVLARGGEQAARDFGADVWSRSLNVAVSIANGLPYFGIRCSSIRPDPWQTTCSACLPGARGTG